MAVIESIKERGIQLDSEFWLVSGGEGWALHRIIESEINEKTGKPSTSKSTWFFGKLEHALSKYLSESASPAKDVEELTLLIKKAYSNIVKFLKSNN